MSKSNPVHLWRFGRTGALIFTLKWLNRAKTGMLHGTPKFFPGLGQGVSRVHKTQVARINWKIKSILSGLVTRRLYFLKKYDTKWPFFPPCRNWPIWECKARGSAWKANWKILDRGQPFNPVTKTCKLCVRERFFILRKPHLASLNHRQEIGTFCPHIRMSLLRNVEKVKVPD